MWFLYRWMIELSQGLGGGGGHRGSIVISVNIGQNETGVKQLD